MPRTSRPSHQPVTREARPARQPPVEHPRVLAAQLYELHRTAGAGEEYLERWPGDAELYVVLQFAETNASRLTDAEAYRQAARLRVMLAEWLRRLADPLQLRAIDDAVSGGVSWDQLALDLRFVGRDGEPTAGSAHNSRSRLYVRVHGQPDDRRQPKVARLIERRTVDARLARAQVIETEDARYPAMDAAARALLGHFESGGILGDPDDDFWWSELANAVDDRRDASERANLVVYVRGAVHETYAFARRTDQPPATTDQAMQVLEAAAALVDAAGAGA